MTIDKELHFNDWLTSLTLADVQHELFRGKHHRALLRAQEQRRRMFYGDNVGRGNDDTLFALAAGEVKFGTKGGRKVIAVVEATA